MTAVDNPAFYTVHQIADMLQISTMTVYRLIHSRQLRAFQVNRSFRVQSNDFDRFMQGADTFESLP